MGGDCRRNRSRHDRRRRKLEPGAQQGLPHRDADMGQPRQDDDARRRKLGSCEGRRQRVGIEHDRLALGVNDRLQLVPFERHPRFARQRQHDQNCIDFIGSIEQLDALLQAAGVDALRGDVDRVARCSIGGDEIADSGLDCLGKLRYPQSLQRNRIRAPDAGAAGDGKHGDAIAFRQWIGRKDGRDGDGFVEIIGNDEAVFGEHRVIGRRPSRHAGGVRGGRALARSRAADLGDDDRLADLGGTTACCEKLVDVANALDEQQNHIGRSVLHQIVQEFASAEIGLVPGADHITQRDAQRPGAMRDRKADATALRDDTDPALRRNQPRCIGLDVDRRAEGGRDFLHVAIKSFRIGP